MKDKTRILDEPQLEFGDALTHQDPRQGLLDGGPHQSNPGDQLNIGVIGSAEVIEKTESFFEEIAHGVESSAEKLPNMNLDFPGLRNRNPYRTQFNLEPAAHRTMTKQQIKAIVEEVDHDKAVDLACEAYMGLLTSLAESSDRPDLAIVALPVEIVVRVKNAELEGGGTTEDEDSSGSDAPNFRGKLKAAAMHLPFAIQILWEDVVDDKAKIPQKLKKDTDRKIQDKAARAWNLTNSIYYKALGRVPFRRYSDASEYRSCYIGISFYRDVSGQQLWTSAAQMFDERGKGYILRGRRAQTEARGRNPYMANEDARDLTSQVLEAYREHHKHYPARVLVLKTSRFKDSEVDGIDEALREANVELKDLVWINERHPVKVFRDGNYPVMRGTFVDLGGRGLLYTVGSIPYYQTYPGLYVPNPLLLCPHEDSESTLAKIAEEVFSLTKVNWNSTQMNQKFPAPIRAARNVAQVLKYVPEDRAVSSDYRKYM
jgi:hypothetical protein